MINSVLRFLTRSRVGDLRAPLALLFAWGAMCVLIWPAGEFVINDDWAFSLPVKWLVETGELRLTFWQAMTLVAQVGVGALWSLIFGFSHENLRLLSILFAGAFLIGVYALARECGLSRRMASATALAFPAFTPFTMPAMSFMTEAYALASSTWALVFFLKAIKSNGRSATLFAAGVICLTFSILVRQTAIGVAAGLLCADLLLNGPTRRVWLRSGGTFLLSVAMIAVYPSVLSAVSQVPSIYLDRVESVRGLISALLSFKLGALKPAIETVLGSVVYFGLLFLPFGLSVLWRFLSTARSSTIPLISAAAIAGLILAALVFANEPMPLIGDEGILRFEGVGPRLLLGDPDGSVAPLTGWWLLTAASVVSASTLISAGGFAALRELRSGALIGVRQRSATLAFLLVVAVVSLLPYALSYGAFFDRYILASAAPFMLALAMLIDEFEKKIARAAIVFLPLFAASLAAATVMTHDFFVWSRARNALFVDAMEMYQLSPTEIDAGWEVSSWFSFDAAFPGPLPQSLTTGEMREFQITNQLVEGFDVLERRSLVLIAPFESDELYLLRVAKRVE